MVIETDSPFLAPNPHRCRRNEPGYAIITAEFISKIKKAPIEKIDEITTKNSIKLFNI
jgi:TatD DNase family protein